MTIEKILFVSYFIFMIFGGAFISQLKTIKYAEVYEIMVLIFAYPLVLLISLGLYFGKIYDEKIN